MCDLVDEPNLNVFYHYFSGAASPQAVKKLLALSEPMSGSTKARPKSSPPPVHRNKLGAGLVGKSNFLFKTSPLDGNFQKFS